MGLCVVVLLSLSLTVSLFPPAFSLPPESPPDPHGHFSSCDESLRHNIAVNQLALLHLLNVTNAQPVCEQQQCLTSVWEAISTIRQDVAALKETNIIQDTVVQVANGRNSTEDECRLPFAKIGGRCLMVETINTASWHEMNNYCRQAGGRLAVLQDANVLYFLTEFIQENGLATNNYWIGATDEEVEGVFKWVDGNQVRMGSPYWGYWKDCKTGTWVQEPNGGTTENCVALWKSIFFI